MAWAAAGYAVLSVQLLDDDADSLEVGPRASREFEALGTRALLALSISRRIQLLADLVAEVASDHCR